MDGSSSRTFYSPGQATGMGANRKSHCTKICTQEWRHSPGSTLTTSLKMSKANACVSKSLVYACAVAYLGGWPPLPASSLPCADWVSHSRWVGFASKSWFLFRLGLILLSAHEMTPSDLFRFQDYEFIIMGTHTEKKNYFLILISPFRKNTLFIYIHF